MSLRHTQRATSEGVPHPATPPKRDYRLKYHPLSNKSLARSPTSYSAFAPPSGGRSLSNRHSVSGMQLRRPCVLSSSPPSTEVRRRHALLVSLLSLVGSFSPPTEPSRRGNSSRTISQEAFRIDTRFPQCDPVQASPLRLPLCQQQ